MDDNTYTIKDFYFWKIVFSLSLASFFIFASLYAVHPLMTIFTKEFNITVSTSSLSLSITVIGLIIGLIVHGFISDRVGRTIFIKLSLLGSIIPFIIIPLFDSFALLLIFRFIQGTIFAGFLAAALAYIGEEINQKNLGLATALYIGSNAWKVCNRLLGRPIFLANDLLFMGEYWNGHIGSCLIVASKITFF